MLLQTAPPAAIHASVVGCCGGMVLQGIDRAVLMTTLIVVLFHQCLGQEHEALLFQTCVANYYIERENSWPHVYIGARTPADMQFFGIAQYPMPGSVGCNLSGLTSSNLSNNRDCPNVCSSWVNGSNDCRLTGFFTDILQRAARVGNFSFTTKLVRYVDANGDYPSGNTTGGVSLTQTVLKALKPVGDCDIYVGPYTALPSRAVDASFTFPIIPLYSALIRKPARGADPMADNMFFFFNGVFNWFVMSSVALFYVVSRCFVYISELKEGEDWVHCWTCGISMPAVPMVAVNTAFHLRKGGYKRQASKNIMVIFGISLAMLGIIYQAAFTEILIRASVERGEFTYISECAEPFTCCYAIPIFAGLFEEVTGIHADLLAKYETEELMWYGVRDGQCRAAITSNLRWAAAQKKFPWVCSTLEEVPAQQGNAALYVLAEMYNYLVFASSKKDERSDFVVSTFDAALAEMRSWPNTGEDESIFGAYTEYFLPTPGCQAAQGILTQSSLEQPIQWKSFVVVFCLFLALSCCLFLCACIPPPRQSDFSWSGVDSGLKECKVEDLDVTPPNLGWLS